MKLQDINFKKYITYLLIAYAFAFPVSKAATNLFEILAILLWVIEGNWKEKFNLYKKDLLSLTIATLIGFSLLSILWHGNAELTLRYVAKYRHLLIIFVFYTSFDTKYSKHVISAFLLGIFISELVSYGIFFEIIHYKNISPTDPTPFMSHMTYSTVLAFAISVLIVQLIFEKNLKFKIFYILFTLSATINLFINGGKTGQIIFIVLIFITTLSSVQHKMKALLSSLLLLSITFFIAFTYSPNFHTRSIQLYSGLHDMVYHNNYDVNGGRRVALSIIGLKTFVNNPILGTGISYHMKNAQSYATQEKLNIKNIIGYSDYHSAFLTISVQLGIIGLFISLLMIYALFSFSIQKKEYKILSVLFATAFVMFSFTHNTFHTMNPMVFFALFAGFFNSLIQKRETHQ